MRFTDSPKGSTERVRLSRKRKALLSDLRELVYQKGDYTALEVLQALVDTLHQQQEI